MINMTAEGKLTHIIFLDDKYYTDFEEGFFQRILPGIRKKEYIADDVCLYSVYQKREGGVWTPYIRKVINSQSSENRSLNGEGLEDVLGCILNDISEYNILFFCDYDLQKLSPAFLGAREGDLGDPSVTIGRHKLVMKTISETVAQKYNIGATGIKPLVFFTLYSSFDSPSAVEELPGLEDYAQEENLECIRVVKNCLELIRAQQYNSIRNTLLFFGDILDTVIPASLRERSTLVCRNDSACE